MTTIRWMKYANTVCYSLTPAIYFSDEQYNYSDCTYAHCKYFVYPYILITYTSLPKVLVNLICEWIMIEDILMHIERLDDYSIQDQITCLLVQSPACINFINVQFSFLIAINDILGTSKIDQLDVSKNIVFCEMKYGGLIHYMSSYDRSLIIVKLYEHTIKSLKKFEKIKNIAVCTNYAYKTVYLTIINYELWLIVCNIVYEFHRTVKNALKHKRNIKEIHNINQ